MKIVEIIVGAERCFNDPYESFSNQRPSVSYKALVEIEDFENAEIETQMLQSLAEQMVEQQKLRALAGLKDKHETKIAEIRQQFAQGQLETFQQAERDRHEADEEQREAEEMFPATENLPRHAGYSKDKGSWPQDPNELPF
jgi:hypothetical protein